MLQKVWKFAFSKTLIKDISIPSTVNDLEENWCDSETKITNIEINEKIQSIQNTGDSNTNSIHNIIFSFDKESTLCKKDILRYSIVKMFFIHRFRSVCICHLPRFYNIPTWKSKRETVYFSLYSIPNNENVIQSLTNEKTKKRIFSIHFELDYNFNDIHIFVKDFLDYFKKEGNELILYMQSFNYEVFDRIIPTQETHAMLTVFGRYVSNQSFKCPIFY